MKYYFIPVIVSIFCLLVIFICLFLSDEETDSNSNYFVEQICIESSSNICISLLDPSPVRITVSNKTLYIRLPNSRIKEVY